MNPSASQEQLTAGFEATDMDQINPEVSVIQKIYKVILQRHDFLQNNKHPYTKFKFKQNGSQLRLDQLGSDTGTWEAQMRQEL